MEHKEMNKKD